MFSSSPTTKAECSAKQAFEWTNGKCIFASGSPFDPVQMHDGRTFYPTQCNNMFVFPGIGLGATLCGAKTGKKHDYMLTREYVPCLTDIELVLLCHTNSIRPNALRCSGSVG